MSTRRVIFWLVTLLVVTVCGHAARDAIGYYHIYQGSQALIAANQTTEHLLRAGRAVIFERGRVNWLLSAAAPADPANLAFVAERRADVESGVRTALTALQAGGEALAAELDRLNAVRRDVDAALAVAQAERRPDVSARWFDASTRFLRAIEAAVRGTSFRPDAFTPRFRLLVRVNIDTLKLRDRVGVESTQVAAALAQKRPMAGSQLAGLEQLRGEITAIWAILREDIGLAQEPRLTAALAALEKDFFGELRPLQDRTIAASHAGQTVDVASKDYSRMAVLTLEGFARLMDECSAIAGDLARATATDAERSLAVHVALAVAAVVLGIAALILVRVRLFHPLQAIQRDLQRLAGGDFASPLHVPPRQDELGAVQSALLRFRDVMLERDALFDSMDRLSRQHQLILQSAAEGIILLDGDGNTVFANDAAAELTGWPPADLVGLSAHDRLHHHHPDGKAYPRDACPIHMTLLDGERRYCENDVFWRRDGTLLAVDYIVNSVREAGRVTGAVVVFRDIGDRLKAEQEAAMLLADLKRSNTELERFAYVASHDLRQPLRMVASYLTLIERSLGSAVSPEVRTFLAFAVDGARRMDRMIHDLLDYSRIGRGDAAPEPVDLADVARRVVAGFAEEIGASGATVTVSDTLPTVPGHASELERLLLNLIGNALKFRVPERPPSIAVTATEGDGDWCVEVSDNGIGIDPKDHDRLFAIFQRLVPSTQYEGTGIGLSVCRKIVEHHGGSIGVRSALGEGCTFIIRLPKSRTRSQSA